jgi:hypothetical protein
LNIEAVRTLKNSNWTNLKKFVSRLYQPLVRNLTTRIRLTLFFILFNKFWGFSESSRKENLNVSWNFKIEVLCRFLSRSRRHFHLIFSLFKFCWTNFQIFDIYPGNFQVLQKKQIVDFENFIMLIFEMANMAFLVNVSAFQLLLGWISIYFQIFLRKSS